MTNNTIDIFDTYTGTGTTITVMEEISRDKGIRIRVVGISEIDDELRKRAMRLHRTRHQITELGDMNEITEEEVPAHHIMIATPPCNDFSTAGKGE